MSTSQVPPAGAPASPAAGAAGLVSVASEIIRLPQELAARLLQSPRTVFLTGTVTGQGKDGALQIRSQLGEIAVKAGTPIPADRQISLQIPPLSGKAASLTPAQLVRTPIPVNLLLAKPSAAPQASASQPAGPQPTTQPGTAPAAADGQDIPQAPPRTTAQSAPLTAGSVTARPSPALPPAVQTPSAPAPAATQTVAPPAGPTPGQGPVAGGASTTQLPGGLQTAPTASIPAAPSPAPAGGAPAAATPQLGRPALSAQVVTQAGTGGPAPHPTPQPPPASGGPGAQAAPTGAAPTSATPTSVAPTPTAATTPTAAAPVSTGTAAATAAPAEAGRMAAPTTMAARPPVSAPPAAPEAPIPVESARRVPALREAVAVLTASDPALATQFVRSVIPQAGTQLAATLLFFLAATRGGDIRGWMGDRVASRLDESGRADLLPKLSAELATTTRPAPDPSSGEWRSQTIPLYQDADIGGLSLHVRQAGDEGSARADAEEGGHRFLIDMDLSRLGPLQLDGLVRDKRLDLTLRSQAALPESMRQDMRTLFREASETVGLQGGLTFQAGGHDWVAMAAVRG